MYCLHFNRTELALDIFRLNKLNYILKNDFGFLIVIKNIEILLLINLGESQVLKSLIASNIKYLQRKKLYTNDFKVFFRILKKINADLGSKGKSHLSKYTEELNTLIIEPALDTTYYLKPRLIKSWLYNNPIFED